MVLVTAGAGTAASPWTITRGADGTVGKTHTAGTAIQHNERDHLTTAAAHYVAGSSGTPVHNLPAAAWLTGAFLTSRRACHAVAQPSLSMPSIPQTAQHLLITASGGLAEPPSWPTTWPSSSTAIPARTTPTSSPVRAVLRHLQGRPRSTGTRSPRRRCSAEGQPERLYGQRGRRVRVHPQLHQLQLRQDGLLRQRWRGRHFQLHRHADPDRLLESGFPGGHHLDALIAPTGGFNVNCQFCLYGMEP